MSISESESGRGWEKYYTEGNLTWVRTEQVGQDYLESLLNSSSLRALLKLSDLTREKGAILEAGCGVGLYSLALAKGGYKVTAFDYNQPAIDIACEISKRVELEVEVNFSTGNLLDIEHLEGSFDLVFNQAVLEYFLDDHELERAIQEMARVTRPGGCVTAIVQNTGHPLRGWKQRFGWQGYDNQPPTRILRAWDIENLMSKAGLSQIQSDGIDPWKGLFHGFPIFSQGKPLHQMSYLIHRALSRLVPLPRRFRSSLAMQFIVSGRKD